MVYVKCRCNYCSSKLMESVGFARSFSTSFNTIIFSSEGELCMNSWCSPPIFFQSVVCSRYFSQWGPAPFLFISFNTNWAKNMSSSLFLLLFSHFSQLLKDGLEAHLTPIHFPDICSLVIFFLLIWIQAIFKCLYYGYPISHKSTKS